MSQYGQVTKRHTFHDFAKLVFCLHTAGTENPDTPQTHPSASNFHEYQSEHPQIPPRHAPDTPQTAPGNTTCQQRTTEPIRQHQTYSNSTCQCLWVSGSVCWRLLACHVLWGCLGGVWGMSGWCLGAFEWYSFKSGALGCVWGLSGFSVLAVWSQNTNLTKS